MSFLNMMLSFFLWLGILLANEDLIKRYKSALADEIEPVIVELIERAEQGLAALEKKEHSLQTKVISITYTFLIIFSLVLRLKILNRGLEMLLAPVLLTSMRLVVFRI